MYDQTTCESSLNATSSPGSESGPTPCDAPAGPTIALSGLEVARANLSARQAKAQGWEMSGICGPLGSTSSTSAALQSCLENRLRAKLQNLGSTLFNLTWKPWVTPQGPSRSRLRASGRSTSETGCTGWPTTTASLADKGVRSHEDAIKEAMRSRGADLAAVVSLASWPTAAARDWKGATKDRWGTNARPLNEVAVLAGWGTPNASAPGGTPEQALARKVGLNCGQSVTTLDHQVQLAGWPTTTTQDSAGSRAYGYGGQEFMTLTDAARAAAGGPPLTGSPVAMASGGQLNPAHSRWLMGYPAAWDVCAPTATRSSRKLRPK